MTVTPEETGHRRSAPSGGWRHGRAPTRLPNEDKPYNIGYGTANSVLIQPDSIIGDAPAPRDQAAARTEYPKQGWIALADQWPRPNVYAAIRAGQLGGAHTQDDLLTWHGLVGNEVMIKNIYSGHVGQNAYGSRRNEILRDQQPVKELAVRRGTRSDRVAAARPAPTRPSTTADRADVDAPGHASFEHDAQSPPFRGPCLPDRCNDRGIAGARSGDRAQRRRPTRGGAERTHPETGDVRRSRCAARG
jgi:hypothetical protein